MVARKNAHKTGDPLEAKIFYKGSLLIDDLLHTSQDRSYKPEIVILKQLFYTLCIIRCKYATLAQ